MAKKFFLLLVGASLLLILSLSSNGGSAKLKPLYLLSLLPYPNSGVEPSWTEGPTLTLAAQLAVDLINNRTDLLPGHILELVVGDSGCNIDILDPIRISFFKHLLYNTKNIAGIVGPACSHSAFTLSLQTAHKEIGTLSVHIAGSHTLQDIYHNSYSTIDSTNALSEAVLKIMAERNWEEVFVVHDAFREFYTSIFNQLRQRSQSKISFYSQILHASTKYYSTLSIAPEECDRTHRILIFLARPYFIATALCYFHWSQRDIVFPSYQYVILGHTLNEVARNATYQNDTHNLTCSADIIKNRLEGAIFIHYRLDPINFSEATDSGLTYTQFTDLYSQSVEAYNMDLDNGEEKIEPSFWAASYFDAVWSLALALNNSREEVKERTGLDLSEYRYGHTEATNIIREKLLQLDFNGVSGRIKFNNSSGFTKRVVDIYQVGGGRMNRLEYYNISDNSTALYTSEPISYIDYRFQALTKGSIPIGIVLLMLLTAIVLLLALLQILSITFTNHRSIKATSPKLYHCAYVGCHSIAIGSLLIVIANSFSIPPVNYCHLEHASLFFTRTGEVLLFSALAAISFRIYRIFVHYMHPGRFISNTCLLMFVTIVTVIVALIHIVIFLNMGSKLEVKCLESYGNTLRVMVNCTHPLHWEIISASALVVLTVLASGFALLSVSKVTIKEFKTTAIILLCYLLYFDSGFWMLAYLSTSGTQDINFIARVGARIAFLCFCLILLFFPPTFPILKDLYNSHLNRCLVQTENKDRDKVHFKNRPELEAYDASNAVITNKHNSEDTKEKQGHVAYSSTEKQKVVDSQKEKEFLGHRDALNTASVQMTMEVFEDVSITSDKSDASSGSVEASLMEHDITRVTDSICRYGANVGTPV